MLSVHYVVGVVRKLVRDTIPTVTVLVFNRNQVTVRPFGLDTANEIVVEHVIHQTFDVNSITDAEFVERTRTKAWLSFPAEFR